MEHEKRKPRAGLGRLGRLVLDALLPPLCLSCGTVVAEPGALCPSCWDKVSFLGQPCCSACGHPFEVAAEAQALCALCAAAPLPFRRARAVFRYDHASKALVLRFKHGDRLEGAPAFGRWMARAGADLIAPVPLHRWRLFSRRYNQAAVLALAVGRIADVPVETGLLIRRRATPAMGHLGRGQREKNVKAAFAVAPRLEEKLRGRTVLLIDDILTTGATAAECSKVLLRSGAEAVDVLTLGRVVLGG